MPYSGAGAIWDMTTGTYIATNVPGAQADYDTAKAAITAGIFYVGPGLEALTIGTFGANVSLMRVTNTGIYAISRFHIADGTDPTKLLAWDASAITTGTTRTATIPNWSGFMLLPVDLGLSGQYLRSNGAGVQPSWNTLVISNALLDGANHTDTAARAVARGALVVGSAAPVWDRLTIGAAGTLLRSDGTDPSWGTVNLLSASHGDTLAGSPSRGDVIVGNSTPAWSRLAIGASGTVLSSNGTDASWSSNPALQHDTLNHLKPFSAANCTWTATQDTISTTGGAFANAKVGDFVNVGANTVASTQGAIITVWTDSNNITVDKTNSGATLSGVTMVIVPGDHWHNTVALDSSGAGCGYFLTAGRGTYTTLAGGTYQEIRGPIRWMGHADGGLETDFDVRVSNSTGTLSGFCFREQGTSNRAYFYVNDLTGSKIFKFPDINGQFFALTGGAQNITDKTFQAQNFFEMEDTPGAGNGCAFRDPTNTSKRLYFNLSTLSASNKTVTFPDYNGRVRVEGAAVTFTNGDTTPTVVGSRLFKTNNAGATSITTFDDGVTGQMITIIFGDANTTLVDGGTLVMAGSANKTFASTDTWTGAYDGSVWYEVCRSIN